MQLLKISEKEYIKIKGSPMTPFFYANEFNSSIFKDISLAIIDDLVVNTKIVNQIAWSMAKTADHDLLDYNLWISLIEVQYSASWGVIINYSFKKWLDIKVDESLERKTTKQSDPVHDALVTLLSAKRMGLSFEELNLLSMNNYIDFISEYISDEKPKKATQEDIDRYFS